VPPPLRGDHYEAIVPAAIGENGTAQAANAFLGPLTDRTSRDFLEVFDKADRPLPNWVLDVEAGDPDALVAANEWLVSDLAQPWLRDTGSPPRWLRLALTPQVIEPVPYLASLSRVITCHGSSHCASLQSLVPLGP
jgi:hypothetical protein